MRQPGAGRAGIVLVDLDVAAVGKGEVAAVTGQQGGKHAGALVVESGGLDAQRKTKIGGCGVERESDRGGDGRSVERDAHAVLLLAAIDIAVGNGRARFSGNGTVECAIGEGRAGRVACHQREGRLLQCCR